MVSWTGKRIARLELHSGKVRALRRRPAAPRSLSRAPALSQKRSWLLGWEHIPFLLMHAVVLFYVVSSIGEPYRAALQKAESEGLRLCVVAVVARRASLLRAADSRLAPAATTTTWR